MDDYNAGPWKRWWKSQMEQCKKYFTLQSDAESCKMPTLVKIALVVIFVVFFCLVFMP